MEGSALSEDAELKQAVRRVVGIAVLRRLRGMVDAESEREAADARVARRLAAGLLLAALLAVAWLAFR